MKKNARALLLFIMGGAMILEPPPPGVAEWRIWLVAAMFYALGFWVVLAPEPDPEGLDPEHKSDQK